MTWRVEPTDYPDVYGAEAVQVTYGNHLLDTIRSGERAGGHGQFWTNGRSWQRYNTRDEAVDASKAEWQLLITANTAAGRPPLFQPAQVISRKNFNTGRRPR